MRQVVFIFKEIMIVQNLELMNNNNQRFDKKDLGELMNNIKDLG